MKKELKPLDHLGYYGYSISADGDVYSHRSQQYLAVKEHQGHLVVFLQYRGASKRVRVATLLAEIFVPKPTGGGYRAKVINGDETDMRASNVAWHQVSKATYRQDQDWFRYNCGLNTIGALRNFRFSIITGNGRIGEESEDCIYSIYVKKHKFELRTTSKKELMLSFLGYYVGVPPEDLEIVGDGLMDVVNNILAKEGLVCEKLTEEGLTTASRQVYYDYRIYMR